MKKIDFKNIAMRVGGVAAGAVAANAAYKVLPESMKPNIKGLLVMAVGAILPTLAGGGKNNAIIENVGDGMIAFGALSFAKAQFNLALNIGEIGEVGEIGYSRSEYIEIPAEVVKAAELADAIQGISDVADSLIDDDELANVAGDEDIAYTGYDEVEGYDDDEY